MNRMRWIAIAALELVLGAVLFVIGIAWRSPQSHFGVWLGLRYGTVFGWRFAPYTARFYVATMQNAALLVGTLLLGSAVFLGWELACAERREKSGLLI
jgi:hypothetical protein